MATLNLTSIKNFFRVLLNLIYPQICLICGHKINDSEMVSICGKCGEKIQINPVNENFNQGKENFHFDRALCPARYDEVIKKCVCLFKYGGKIGLARPLGKIMSDFAIKNTDIRNCDLIVPVPLHPARLRQRQFNQSELLALKIAKIINKKVIKGGVRRIRYTSPQTELTGRQRIKNVKEAFTAKNYAGFKDKTVVLVDDVITTGATLSECAKALKKAGAKKIVAFALAKSD